MESKEVEIHHNEVGRQNENSKIMAVPNHESLQKLTDLKEGDRIHVFEYYDGYLPEYVIIKSGPTWDSCRYIYANKQGVCGYYIETMEELKSLTDLEKGDKVRISNPKNHPDRHNLEYSESDEGMSNYAEFTIVQSGPTWDTCKYAKSWWFEEGYTNYTTESTPSGITVIHDKTTNTTFVSSRDEEKDNSIPNRYLEDESEEKEASSPSYTYPEKTDEPEEKEASSPPEDEDPPPPYTYPEKTEIDSQFTI